MSKFNPKSHILQNWNKPMYIATKNDVVLDDNENEIVTYNEPFFFGLVNYQPLTTKQLEAYIQTYGETENNIVSCLIDFKDRYKFNIFDLAYLYDAKPDNETINGTNANYVVRAFKPQNTKIMVILEELTKEENNNG